MPSFSPKLFLSLSLTFVGIPTLAWGSQVIQVGEENATIMVDQDPGEPWKEDDRICILHDAKEIGCGKVSKATESSAVVNLEFQDEDILEGDQVKAPSNSPRREKNSTVVDEEKKETPPANDLELAKTEGAPEVSPAASVAPNVLPAATDSVRDETIEVAAKNPDDTEKAEADVNEPAAAKPTPEDPERFRNMTRLQIVHYHRDLIHSRATALSGEDFSPFGRVLKKKADITIGGMVYGESGGNSIWPQAAVQISLTPKYSLVLGAAYYGFQVAGFKSTTVGGSVGVAYYPSNLYDGVFGTFGGGVGITAASAGSTSGSAISLNVLGTVGYRWLIGGGFNLSIHGGGQFFSVPAVTGVTVGSATIFLPLLAMDLGFCF